MTQQQKEEVKICNEIRMARLEKAIETIEAENYGLKQRIKELEHEIRFATPTFAQPVEVIGEWYTTTSNKEKDS